MVFSSFRCQSTIYLRILFLHLINANDFPCLQSNTSDTFCSNTNSTDASHVNPRQCLTCKVRSVPNQFQICQNRYQCVHFEFIDFETFETFFNRYHQQVTMIFDRSRVEHRENNLNIYVEHDRMNELILSNLYSIVHFNRTFYGDFYLILDENRSKMIIYLDRDLFDISLTGLSISISCQNSTKVHLMFVNKIDVMNKTENCLSSYRIRSVSTSTITKTKKRWILFLIGTLLLLFWCTCLTYLFYIRVRRWKFQTDSNQRASFISNAFSNDSFESQHDEILPIETKQHSEQSSVRGLYAFDREF